MAKPHNFELAIDFIRRHNSLHCKIGHKSWNLRSILQLIFHCRGNICEGKIGHKPLNLRPIFQYRGNICKAKISHKFQDLRLIFPSQLIFLVRLKELSLLSLKNYFRKRAILMQYLTFIF